MPPLPAPAVLAAGLMLIGASQAGDESLIRRCKYPARPDSSWVMPKELREVSGLAAFQGTLLAHNDEVGQLFAIDPRTGAVKLWLTLQGAPRDDFEGVAVIGGTAWMMTSVGRLYTFPARAATAPVSFQLVDTKLGGRCEFEGLAVDSGSVLLLPCKTLPKGQAGIVVYRWDTRTGAPATPATITVPAAALRKAGFKAFRPSAIERDAATGHLLVLSANPAGVLELDRSGAIVGAVALRGHPQAEGIAFGEKRALLISDEGVKGPGRLSRYACAA